MAIAAPAVNAQNVLRNKKMKITKQQLKKIIKEELSGVLKEMNPEIPGEELPQGGELDQALDADAPLSREEQIDK